MTQYIVLIYGDEKIYQEGGQGLYDEVMKGHNDFGSKHHDKVLGGNALQSVDTATSIRKDASGAFGVTDGPFVETKEALGGFYLLEAPQGAIEGGMTDGERAPDVSIVAPVFNERENLERSVSGPATVFPRVQANIAARITVPIRALRVQKGDTVAAGQLLATLDNTDLLAQRREAIAVVADAQASLEKISSGTQPTDMERARGQLRAAEAGLNQVSRSKIVEYRSIPQVIEGVVDC